MAKAKAVAEEKGAEKFMLLPVLVLILAQMGTSAITAPFRSPQPP